ncbi:hypothetical protein LJR290_006619 [Variovorax sp. LjRoot290]|uniref:hypothetical protein n=1 Tax=unclassified Variovorax TaxID=663243 RepID=UPI003ECDC247
MNNSFVRLIDGMCATLRGEVLTRLDDDFARGQVFGVINLLNTFKVRADWSTNFLWAQVDAQRHTFARIGALLQESGTVTAPTLPIDEVPQPITPTELASLRDGGNRAIVELLAWLAAERESLEPTLVADVEQLARACMRTELDLELKYSPRPMFAEMSSGVEVQAKP